MTIDSSAPQFGHTGKALWREMGCPMELLPAGVLS